MIRRATPADALPISRIYNHYIANTTSTFEEQEVSVAVMQRRMQHIMQTYPWLVFEEQGEVLGYAYACQWKPRSAYRYSVETTVYVKDGVFGKGIGTKLYSELLAQLVEMGIHTAIGGIVLPNPSSIALHEKLGYEKIGQFKEVGFKFGKWLDVGYWERIL